MRFVYGRQELMERARGEENGYLLTNGLGGYSSATMIGSNTRGDHGLFLAATDPPGGRIQVISRLEETLTLPSGRVGLSSQAFRESEREETGHRYLESASFEEIPRFVYRVRGVEIVKEIAMKQGKNLVAVRYRIWNATKDEVCLRVAPHLQMIPKGTILSRDQAFELDLANRTIRSGGVTVRYVTNGEVRRIPERFVENLYFPYDERDGRPAFGNTFVNHEIQRKAAPAERTELELLYSLDEPCDRVSEIFREAVRYREELAERSGFSSDFARTLAKSADQFVARRRSTGGKTMLAGFPFFEDWGRDTMIALPGCCIAAGQYETAASILRTFAAYCREGLMPNLFPGGGREPWYNTADASLLFIHAVWMYAERTGDLAFVREMWPVMEEIVAWYQKGTAFGIHMDADGLICAGTHLDQVTWMDVRIGDFLPTPRHGKPVEINAYWYSALRMLGAWSEALNVPDCYTGLARRVRESFGREFWNEEAGCLKDLVSGTKADRQIRCNQIWAVSQPFSLLSTEKERQVVDTVSAKLYTPLGLRTLDPEDPEYHGSYGGPQSRRDLAYHQGTVWVFPLGAYYLAYLKTRGYSGEAKREVAERLTVLEAALREGCAGQLPEIYDGDAPGQSRGCFAQAWSVGEILRVCEALEKR